MLSDFAITVDKKATAANMAREVKSFVLSFRFRLSLLSKKISPAKKQGENYCDKNSVYLLSSGLYRRLRNFTESAKWLAGLWPRPNTAGGESHPALKTYSNLIICREPISVNLIF